MRFVWTAILSCALGLCRAPPSGAATLPLHECRLEHPLDLVSLPARCGALSVAEDPARAASRRIALFVAVVPALDRGSSAAPLFILAGGPGQAATDLYASLSGAFARIHRDRDIVLVDQRGTGKSTPLICDYPDEWGGAGDKLEDIRRATLACLARYGDRVRFYTTSIAVQDLDRVRESLGYAWIDLYGSSYGTRVAELYMRRHPKAVHAVILDGVTYPEQAIGPDTPLDAERSLERILARCEAARPCAAAFPALDSEIGSLRRRFGPEVIPLSLPDPGTGAPLPIDFDHSVLSAALRFLSYNAAEASILPSLIHEAALGRLAPLAAQTVMMSRQISHQLASGMQNSVICSEDVPFFHLTEDLRRRIEQTYQGSEQLDALEAICQEWPRGPVDADLHDPLHSDAPTLLLSGEDDPVTPPADAERLARELTHVRHLILSGEGHGQAATGCIPRLMATFLDSSDPAGLDASCLERHRSAPFFVAPTGPAP